MAGVVDPRPEAAVAVKLVVGVSRSRSPRENEERHATRGRPARACGVGVCHERQGGRGSDAAVIGVSRGACALRRDTGNQTYENIRKSASNAQEGLPSDFLQPNFGIIQSSEPLFQFCGNISGGYDHHRVSILDQLLVRLPVEVGCGDQNPELAMSEA